MTPEGRRRKARAIAKRVDFAVGELTIAYNDLAALCTELGIRPPALVAIVEAQLSGRRAVLSLETLLRGLTMAVRS